MSRVIPIIEHSATVIPLRQALVTSVRSGDEIDLAGELMRCGGETIGSGESIRQLALLGDQPSIFVLGDTLATLYAAERAVFAYAVARGLKLQGLPPDVVDLPSDTEPR